MKFSKKNLKMKLQIISKLKKKQKEESLMAQREPHTAYDSRDLTA